jgi:hypothetical protein
VRWKLLIFQYSIFRFSLKNEFLQQNPQQDELTPQEEARREAAELLDSLREKEDRKKALLLIVDDEEHKRRLMNEFITQGGANRDAGYVVSLKKDGASAIRLYGLNIEKLSYSAT